MKSDLLYASINLSITLSNVHLRLGNFPKKDLKVVVLFYLIGLTIVSLRYLSYKVRISVKFRAIKHFSA